MAEEANFVMLNKQNIDLKRRLGEAEEIIDELRVKLSQQTQHIFEVRQGPKSLAELFHGKVGNSSNCPQSARMDGSESVKQERGSTNPNVSSQSHGAVSSAIPPEEYDAMESELEAAKATELLLRNELRRVLETSGEASKSESAELTAARKRIEELQSSERKLKEALDDLNSFVECGAGQMGTNADASGGGAGAAASSIATDLLEVELEMVKERLGAEEALNAEWDARMRATQLELDELRSTLEQRDRRLSEAVSERNIAVRVKNEALKEAALARAEVERLKKDALRAQQRKHDDSAAGVAAVVEGELRAQVAALEARVHQLDAELTLARTEAAKAQKAGKRAFVERQTALKDLEKWKREAMAGSRKGLRGTTNQASSTDVVACAEGAAQKFDALISAAAATSGTDDASLFGGGDDWAQFMYEAFFDYERQICNLKSEVLSLQAIAQMNEADASTAFRSQIAAHKEEIEVLRDALNEHRQKAASLGGRGPVMTGVTVTAVPLGYPQRNRPHDSYLNF